MNGCRHRGSLGVVQQLVLSLLLGMALFLFFSTEALAEQPGFVLSGPPPGAEIFLDERKIGTMPLPGRVLISPGTHQLKIVRPGYAPYNEPLSIYPDKLTQVIAEMTPLNGVLRLTTVPDKARVWMDGGYLGESPVEVEMPVGPHVVRVARGGFVELEFVVSSIAGLLVERRIALTELPERAATRAPILDKERSTQWYKRWWAWTLLALGAGAATTAIVVPITYTSRQPCQRLDVELCLPILTAGASSTPSSLVLIGGRF